jgi:hypothetical protein
LGARFDQAQPTLSWLRRRQFAVALLAESQRTVSMQWACLVAERPASTLQECWGVARLALTRRLCWGARPQASAG